MSYLISRGAYPFTADDLLADLGLTGRQMNPIIEVGIQMICDGSRRTVTEAVWALAETDDANAIGRIKSVGEPYQLDAKFTDRRWFRNHTYRPDPKAIANARQRVIAWCKRQPEIDKALRETDIIRTVRRVA